MRRTVTISCVGVLLAVMATFAYDMDITSFSGNGEVTWTHQTNHVTEYRIEWHSDLTQGQWCDLNGGLRGIVPTSEVMSASVPMFYRIKALDAKPANMVYIPAGWFNMGNSMDPSDGWADELPVHKVYVSGFYMEQYEVSEALWDNVYMWATNNGYSFDNSGSGKETNHPVHTVDWYDCVKWANARSEYEDKDPVYFTQEGLGSVYRTGEVDYPFVRWQDNGYRLPTEAEWEKAARGGGNSYRFPWADDVISHKWANYTASTNYSYDLSSGGYHPDYDSGGLPYTSPVGSFAPNGYGLFDMAGNVLEWCWDRYGDTYYASSSNVDPRGPDWGFRRVCRGGDFTDVAYECRLAARDYTFYPTNEWHSVGFRLVRSAP